jgi:FtsZ-interacting cell division protein YlmF
MVDDYRDSPQEKPVFATESRNGKREIDLFPALQDRRMMAVAHGGARQATPTRLGSQISMFSPVSFEEALDIVECLRSRAATTISLENMKKLDASRLVDFVAGASAAIDGDFHKLSEQVYVFAPSNIKISAPVKESPHTSSTTFGDITFGSLTAAPQALSSVSESTKDFGKDLGLGALDFLYPGRASQETTSPTPTVNWPGS